MTASCCNDINLCRLDCLDCLEATELARDWAGEDMPAAVPTERCEHKPSSAG